MTQRNQSIDILKGIGIILMIVAHTYGPGNITWNLIFSFHMPLFFIASGLFFKDRSVKETIRKISKQLLIQYIFICVSVTILSQAKQSHPIKYDLKEAMYGMGPGWFIIAMAQVKIYFTFIFKTFKSYYIIVSFVISSLAIIMNRIYNISMILAIMPALCSLFFYAFGYYANTHLDKYYIKRHSLMCLFFCLLFWLNTSFFGKVELATCTFKLLIIDFMGCFGGTYVFYSISKKIESTKIGIFLSYAGKYSLAILCLHSIDFCIPIWHHLDRYIPVFLFPTLILIMRLILLLICCYYISNHHKLSTFFNIK